jgi:D-alanyl-D-alanine carboxypeptidase
VTLAMLVAAAAGAIVLVPMFRARVPHVDPSIVDPADRVRAFLDELLRDGLAPGLQYVAVGPTGVRLDYAGGTADLGRRTPMTSGTTMMWYSVSKTITAAAVLQLVADGRIGLDDAVDRYVTGVPYGAGVTIRRLLSHTAGVPTPIPLAWVHPAARHDSFDERAALDAVLSNNPRLSSEPGSRFRYSNLGYWLLGPVVERVTGQRFTDDVEREVIGRLGLDRSALGYLVGDPARQATGYLEKYSFTNLVKGWLVDAEYVGPYEGPWLTINPHYVNGPAFGGLIGTAAGMSRFLLDQLQPESSILPPQARALFYARQSTTDGTPVPMTLGWHVGQLDGEEYFYKEGGGAGFHSMIRLYPTHAIGTAVIANATGLDVRTTLDRADRQFFGSVR